MWDGCELLDQNHVPPFAVCVCLFQDQILHTTLLICVHMLSQRRKDLFDLTNHLDWATDCHIARRFKHNKKVERLTRSNLPGRGERVQTMVIVSAILVE